MSRLASFLGALIALPVIVAGIAYPEPASRSAVASSISDPLCVNGRPAKRLLTCGSGVVQPCISYGGLRPRQGYQRDHLCPLGLGCPDTIENVRHQRCDRTGQFGRCEAGPAADKDKDEHTAEENYCSGRWSLDYARSRVAKRWPVDAAHGYDDPLPLMLLQPEGNGR